jgi:sulfhydrogenase subunit alpha
MSTGRPNRRKKGSEETQMQPAVKRVEVHHLTRVEGHGNIVVALDAQSNVLECRWEVPEAPRFFEAMLWGRPYHDVHQITSRICGICSIGHQLASLQATEEALDVQITTQTLKLRKLALHAENLQSHLLHIGFLVLPDLLGVGSVLPLAETHREEVLNIIAARKMSNEFSAMICGRTTHPQSMAPGGMLKLPKEGDLRRLSEDLKGSLPRLQRLVELFAALDGQWPKFNRPTEYVALVTPQEYALYRGELGSTRDQRRSVRQYLDLVNEYCVPHSTAKWARNVGASYMVGALARFNLNSRLLSPGAQQAAARLGMVPPVTNPFYNTPAQLVECIHSVEDSLELLDGLLTRGIRPERPIPVAVKEGRGVGAVEVPRGILFHAYEYDGKGRVLTADCVIPTNQNHANIQLDFEALVPSLAGMGEPEIERTLSMLVRAYDPCISCSTHLIDLSGPSGPPVRFERR